MCGVGCGVALYIFVVYYVAHCTVCFFILVEIYRKIEKMARISEFQQRNFELSVSVNIAEFFRRFLRYSEVFEGTPQS